MNTQAKIHILHQNQDVDTALVLLQQLHETFKACEETVLNLPLRQYEILNKAVPIINVRNHLSRTRERFEDGINALLGADVA